MTTRKTILLIEDEFDTRELLGRALTRAGYAAITAANAAEALSAANGADTIDLVITDVVLGTDSLSGLELMTALRRAGVRAPVIIITAYADVEKLKSRSTRARRTSSRSRFARPSCWK